MTCRAVTRRALIGLTWVTAISAWAAPALSQGVYLENPNWNITLSDYGYSDYLLDNTPGFIGREYLSGEWGAAIAYKRGDTPVAPTWLDPDFWYPDWTTNSNFSIVTAGTSDGNNAQGLPIMHSVISNGEVEITLRYEMLDTVTGTPMGIVRAGVGGAGGSIRGNRYVMVQTYTVKNVADDDLKNLQLFQLLHGLSSQSGVYDNRPYTGPLGAYRYDATLRGVDETTLGAGGSSSSGLEDFIGFSATAVPSAFEIGYYGIDDGTDNHYLGKPSDGVHLSIEDNWSTAPYNTRQGTDTFSPATRWVAGGQRWELGTLAQGESVSLSVLLSILTGTTVESGAGGGCSGGANGGSTHVGGVDFSFENVGDPGNFFAEYALADSDELAEHIAEGEFSAPTFSFPGANLQLWDLEFSGSSDGAIQLVFAYDPAALPDGFDESQLDIYHYTDFAWEALHGTVDTLNHTIAVEVDHLSPFALGDVQAVPEPATLGLLAIGGAALLGAGKRRRAA